MKKLINKNVIKAMTLGISALMMANSMNLTAFASEGDNNTTPVDGGTNNQEDKQETMPTAVLENVQEEAADAKEAVEEAIGVEAEAAVIVEADAPAQESGEETTVLEVIDAAKDMGFTEEAAAIENELDNDNLSYEADDKVGDQNVPVDVNEAIGDINTALDLMAEQDKAINDAVKDANDAAKSADDAVQKANDLLGISVQEDGSVSVSILDVVSTSSDAIDEAEKNITGATTIAEADDAMNDAQTAADSADKIVTDTQTAFDAIEKEYDEAVEKYNAAREDLNNALAEHAALRETAVADAKAAEEELQRLSDEVAKLKKAADQAAGYAKIAKLEKEMLDAYNGNIEGKSGKDLTFKDDYRPLAKAIIETYYINDVLHGTLVGEIEWVEATSGSYEYKDKDGTKSTRGNVLNYGYFKYLDENGVEHEKYVNYKTAKENKTDTGRGIVIFEKTEHVLADGTVEYRNDNWYTGNLILAQRDLPADEYVHDGLVPSYIKESAEYQANLKAYLEENKDNRKMSAKSIVVDQSQNDTFRANLEAATKTIAEYEALSNQAKAAQEKVDSANAKVKELEDSISKLGKQIVYLDENADFTAEDLMEYDIPAVNIKVVNALKAKLGTAKEALQAAQDQKAEIDAKLEVVKAEYQAKVAELTPSGETVTATTETETPATDDAAPAGEVAAPAPAAPAAPVIIVPAALEVDGDAADIDAVSGAGEDLAQTAEIENEVAALAGTIPADEKKIYDIVNDPTALAELIEEPGVKIRAYWWILIIAALGATGWALYRQYKKNKAAEANGGRKN